MSEKDKFYKSLRLLVYAFLFLCLLGFVSFVLTHLGILS